MENQSLNCAWLAKTCGRAGREGGQVGRGRGTGTCQRSHAYGGRAGGAECWGPGSLAVPWSPPPLAGSEKGQARRQLLLPQQVWWGARPPLLLPQLPRRYCTGAAAAALRRRRRLRRPLVPFTHSQPPARLGHEEVHERPELHEVILERGACMAGQGRQRWSVCRVGGCHTRPQAPVL